MMKCQSLCLIAACLFLGCSRQENIRPLPTETQNVDRIDHAKKSSTQGDLNVSVHRAPVAADGITAHAVTDIVLNFRALDPLIDGISIKKDGTVQVVLDEAFENTGGSGNIAIILQGWPQSPPAPPPFIWTTTVIDHTITVELNQDFPIGMFGPGPKQVHLALFGFKNPGPGIYPIHLSIKPDPNAAGTKEGIGYVQIIPKSRPAISAVSIFSGGGPPPPFNNAIYQTVTLGGCANTVGLYLWDKMKKPFVGVDILMVNPNHGRLIRSDGSTAGQVWISSPSGAAEFSLTTESPATLGSAFLTGVEVGILKTKFTPDPAILGNYQLSLKMNNGNTQDLFVHVVSL